MNEIKKTKNKAFTTMILGFFVCFFMVGIYIITNNVSTSYALPITIDAKDIDEITTKTQVYYQDRTSQEIVTFDKSSTMNVDMNQYMIYTKSFASQVGNRAYYTTSDKFVGTVTLDNGTSYELDMFCLEYLRDVPNAGEKYVRDTNYDKYIDEGIVYIINEAYKDVQLNGNKLTLGVDKYYDAQVAIWIYQELNKNKPFYYCQATECAPSPTGQIETETMEELAKLKHIWEDVQNNHASGEAKRIYDYVVGAQAAKKSETTNEIKVKAGKVELKLTDDKEYYQTDLIEVEVATAANTTFTGFGFALDSDEYSTTVIDENGNTITDYSQLANNKFRIRVPASSLKVGEKTTITGDFTARFSKDTYLAYKHESDNSYQRALLVATTSSDQSVPLKLEVTVPDTGIDYSQYIYIIGAMVLVIGLTVIYVNTKSKEI